MKFLKLFALSVMATAMATSVANAQVKPGVKEFRILESGGPSGESDQSRVRISAPIAPP